MPGRTTGDNKFGPSPWVVGPTLGDGVNYSTIQEAINDAAAAGGGQVLIRGSTYTEDLVFGTNVNLIAVEVSGFASDVVIIGNHTYTGNGALSFEAINFQCGAGTDVFNVTPTAPALALQFSNCDIDASSVSNGNGIVGNAAAAVLAIVTADTRVRADLHCFQLDGFTQMVFNGTCTSTNGNVVLATSAYQVRYEDSFAASNVIGNFDLPGTGTFFCNHCRLQSQQETFTIGAASEIQCTNNVINCDAGSGFFATGTGTFRYADLSLAGAAIVIDPALTLVIYDWKPYATSDVVASPSGGRGTAQFDSAQFTVVDGFVQFTGTAVPTTFTEDTGTPVSPVANNVNVQGSGGIVTNGTGDTITIEAGGTLAQNYAADSGTATPIAQVLNIIGGTGVLTSASGNTVVVNAPLWSIVSASTAITANTGSILNIGVSGTITLPTGVPTGSVIEIYNANTSDIDIQADVADIIRIGFNTSTSGGTATTNLGGDWIRLVYANTFNQWLAAGVVGNWTLA